MPFQPRWTTETKEHAAVAAECSDEELKDWEAALNDGAIDACEAQRLFGRALSTNAATHDTHTVAVVADAGDALSQSFKRCRNPRHMGELLVVFQGAVDELRVREPIPA